MSKIIGCEEGSDPDGSDIHYLVIPDEIDVYKVYLEWLKLESESLKSGRNFNEYVSFKEYLLNLGATETDEIEIY
jgi:hypothetical protein